MKNNHVVVVVIFLLLIPSLTGCGGGGGSGLNCYRYSGDIGGCVETVDNIQNLSISSTDESVFKAEYMAGFVQGRLQGSSITQARDNTWDTTYLIDPSHSFPKQIPPSAAELELTRRTLQENYNYTISYITTQGASNAGVNLKRLLFRMLGVYHGAVLTEPEALDFSGDFLPESSYFTDAELALGYSTVLPTFMDIYFINAAEDVFSALPAEEAGDVIRIERCSAFIKKFGSDIAIAHNAWWGFLDQSLAISQYVNGLYQSFNSLMPGMISSETDFGYTSNGLMFTGVAFHPTVDIQGKTLALWGFWKAALAEQFSSSLDEFYTYFAIDADNLSGTSVGGYLVVDTKTGEIATIENSQQSIVYIKSNSSGSYDVVTNPEGLSTEYDYEIVDPEYIIGINYPASTQIREDLQAIDSRPARREQFLNPAVGIETVADIASAKALITYTDPDEPLSIYGRWDLGYGDTPTPKTVPDGSIDAKVILASMTGYASQVTGELSSTPQHESIWMKYGTASIAGKPFIWSESQWSGQTLRGVPDRVDGSFQLLQSYIK